MKRLTANIITKEQSHGNVTHVPAYAGKNRLLMRYLESAKFQQDFERAMQEKAATR